MKLIVRVCDYDWGKRDDNLGEIVIDARDLALSYEPKTYDLTRNGRQEKGSITLVADFIPSLALKPAFDRDQSSMNTSEETLVLKVLKANNLRKGDWFSGNDVYVQVWRAPDGFTLPPPPMQKLPEPPKRVKLPNESMTWRFAFPTRADTPGSAFLKAGDKAFIVYYIKAEIDKKSWKNPSLKVPFTIIPTRPAPSPVLLLPIEIEHQDQIKKMKLCCFSCGEAGPVTIRFQVGRRAYAPGQTVDLMNSEIVNNSSIHLRARVVLRQQVVLSTTSRSMEFRFHTENRLQLGHKMIAPKSEFSLDDMKIIIPAVPPSFFGAKGSTTAFREPLTYTYSLSLQGKAESGHKVKIDIPVLISALPPKASAIRDASNQNIDAPVVDDPFRIQEYSILDDKPCATVAPVTGLEDDNGQIVPAMTGGGNIYEVEDSGNGLGFCHYEPQVVVFSSSDDSFKPTESPICDIPTAPDVEKEDDVQDAYNKLLERLKVEYDSRLVVDDWIKQYPRVASTLTPKEFAGILRNILFSLEQASIARELTMGFHMNHGKLTTDHVNAALEACPYSKMEILRVMAPYVVDAHKKESVLVHLYSYEREEATNLFP
jgi:hypothetical protein